MSTSHVSGLVPGLYVLPSAERAAALNHLAVALAVLGDDASRASEHSRDVRLHVVACQAQRWQERFSPSYPRTRRPCSSCRVLPELPGRRRGAGRSGRAARPPPARGARHLAGLPARARTGGHAMKAPNRLGVRRAPPRGRPHRPPAAAGPGRARRPRSSATWPRSSGRPRVLGNPAPTRRRAGGARADQGAQPGPDWGTAAAHGDLHAPALRQPVVARRRPPDDQLLAIAGNLIRAHDMVASHRRPTPLRSSPRCWLTPPSPVNVFTAHRA